MDRMPHALLTTQYNADYYFTDNDYFHHADPHLFWLLRSATDNTYLLMPFELGARGSFKPDRPVSGASPFTLFGFIRRSHTRLRRFAQLRVMMISATPG